MTRAVPIAILVLLLAVLVWQWHDWPPSPHAGQTEASSATSDSAESVSTLANRLKTLDDRESYANVIERPIFRPDRKPDPLPEKEASSAQSMANTELATLDLTAVMITPTLVSAWVRKPDQPKLVQLRVGDEFVGWSVREILDDRVLLERQGEKYALILRDYAKAPAGAPAPPSVPRRQPRTPDAAPPPPVRDQPPPTRRPS